MAQVNRVSYPFLTDSSYEAAGIEQARQRGIYDDSLMKASLAESSGIQIPDLASAMSSASDFAKEGDSKGKTIGKAATSVGIGLAGSVASNMMDKQGSTEQQYNNKKYGTDASATSSVAGAIGTAVLGPIGGAALSAGVNVLNSVGNKVSTEDNYGRTGGSSAGNITGDVIGAITDPIGSLTDAFDRKDKGYGFFGGKSKQASDRRKEGEKRKVDVEAQRGRLDNINSSKALYADTMANANMYSGSYIAKNGGILLFRKGSIITSSNENIEKPTKRVFTKLEKKEVENSGDNLTIRVLRSGGNLTNTSTKIFNKPVFRDKAIIMNGALHSEFNNIGDKGLPIIMADGGKIYEIEREELLFDNKSSNLLLELQKKGDKKALGKGFADILFNNTESKSENFKCLNNNTCNI